MIILIIVIAVPYVSIVKVDTSLRLLFLYRLYCLINILYCFIFSLECLIEESDISSKVGLHYII